MGLAELILGKDNGFAQWANQNQGRLGAIASGLGSGQNIQSGLAAAAQNQGAGAILDRQEAERRIKMEEAQANKNATLQYLGAKFPDLAAAVNSGLPIGDAYNEAFKRSAPGYGAGPEPTANMRDFQFAQANPGYADFLNPAKQPNYPTGYTAGANGGLTFIPGGPADPANKPVRGMNATVQKELFEADDSVQAGQSVIQSLDRALELNPLAYDGPFADQRSYVSALAGDAGGKATQDLKNVVTAQALDSLKAVFGGMPTEGERKILLEIQGSVDQPKAVREDIFKRARAAAERRNSYNQKKAQALRSGQYFDEGYSAGADAVPSGNYVYNPATGKLEPQ